MFERDQPWRFMLWLLDGSADRDESFPWYNGVDITYGGLYSGHDECLQAWAEKQPPGTYKVAVKNGKYLRFSTVHVAESPVTITRGI